MVQTPPQHVPLFSTSPETLQQANSSEGQQLIYPLVHKKLPIPASRCPISEEGELAARMYLIGVGVIMLEPFYGFGGNQHRAAITPNGWPGVPHRECRNWDFATDFLREHDVPERTVEMS
jgi:hypothetical protein